LLLEHLIVGGTPFQLGRGFLPTRSRVRHDGLHRDRGCKLFPTAAALVKPAGSTEDRRHSSARCCAGDGPGVLADFYSQRFIALEGALFWLPYPLAYFC